MSTSPLRYWRNKPTPRPDRFPFVSPEFRTPGGVGYLCTLAKIGHHLTREQVLAIVLELEATRLPVQSAFADRQLHQRTRHVDGRRHDHGRGRPNHLHTLRPGRDR